MKLRAWLCLSIVTTGCVSNQTLGPWTDNFNEARNPAVALDAREFIIKRQGCDHFRGEPGYDVERKKFINQQTEKLCKGTDADLKFLRKKYTDQPETIKALAGFENCIEYATQCKSAGPE